MFFRTRRRCGEGNGLEGVPESEAVTGESKDAEGDRNRGTREKTDAENGGASAALRDPTRRQIRSFCLTKPPLAKVNSYSEDGPAARVDFSMPPASLRTASDGSRGLEECVGFRLSTTATYVH
jgi:hypothetical protein